MATLLKKGSSGDEVRKLQEALNSAGYKLDVDGVYGDKTASAVSQYQKANGLSVDGIAGDQTWGKLTGGQTTSPTAENKQTAVTPLGTEYDPTATTGTKADLTAIEGKAPTFTESQAYKDAMGALQQHQSAKPGEYQSGFQERLDALQQQIAGGTEYKSPYEDKYNELYDKIMNREAFSYDFNADPMYQQYKDQYIRGGQRAMQDAMAEAAALSGGHGNSYAATAGNLAYQEHLNGLNNVIPELQTQAYQRYMNENNDLLNQMELTRGLDEMAYGRHRDNMSDLVDQYGMLMDAEQQAYDRYRDETGDYYKDLEYLTGAAQDQYNRDYAAHQDAMNKYLTDREYYYGKTMDELAAEAAAAKSSGGSKNDSSNAGNKSGDYNTVLANAKNMSASNAFEYVGRMVDSGVITAAEADRILTIEIGMDLSEYAQDDNSVIDAIKEALKSVKGGLSSMIASAKK